MKNALQGSTVFITGASSGIGKSCAEQFAALGANLVITARRFERLEKLAKDLAAKYQVTCTPMQLDVRKNDEVEAVFQELNKNNIVLDIVVNNAGLSLSTDKMQEGAVSDWDIVIDTNIKGLLYVTRAALPTMLKNNKGHIINIGSIAGHACYAGGNVYCATKHAVRAITKSLRLDVFGSAIRVSEIAPGAVETEFSEVRFHDKEKAKKLYQGFTPLHPEDIADAVLYCATRPPHVNISELVVFPQAQASITDVYRPGELVKDPFKSTK